MPALPAAVPLPRPGGCLSRTGPTRGPTALQSGAMVATLPPRRPPGSVAGRMLGRRWRQVLRRLREDDLVPSLLLCSVGVLIAVAQVSLPLFVPVTALLIPMVVANLVLPPRSLPWTLDLRARPRGRRGRDDPSPAGLAAHRRGGGHRGRRPGDPALLQPSRQAGRGRGAGRVDAGRPAGPDPAPGPRPRPPRGLVRRCGAALVGRVILRRRLPGGLPRPGRLVAAGRGGRRLGQGGAGGGPVAAAGRCVRWAAGSAAGATRSCPRPTTTCCGRSWSEGFATAVHVDLDLATGAFELRSAGHPPGVQLLAGSGRWAVHQAEGPVLGVLPDAEFTVVRGTLHRGDALLLFTDGVVETPHRDISATASTGCWGRASSCSAPASRAGRPGTAGPAGVARTTTGPCCCCTALGSTGMATGDRGTGDEWSG